jgi:hypothetical protein
MKPSVTSDSSDSDDQARRNPAEADIRAEQVRCLVQPLTTCNRQRTVH